MAKTILSKHAKEQIASRGIAEEAVWKILSENKPYKVEEGLTIYHGLITENNKQYLIRIFVNENINPNLVVTVYKTSKTGKYL